MPAAIMDWAVEKMRIKKLERTAERKQEPAQQAPAEAGGTEGSEGAPKSEVKEGKAEEKAKDF